VKNLEMADGVMEDVLRRPVLWRPEESHHQVPCMLDLEGFSKRKDNQQVKRYQKPEGPDWRKGQ
jgi:hypothetical protein